VSTMRPNHRLARNANSPGQFWKTPFVWQAGCPEPPISARLRFEPADDLWLHGALQQVMATSLNESDQYLVAKAGPAAAVDELMSLYRLL